MATICGKEGQNQFLDNANNKNQAETSFRSSDSMICNKNIYINPVVSSSLADSYIQPTGTKSSTPMKTTSKEGKEYETLRALAEESSRLTLIINLHKGLLKAEVGSNGIEVAALRETNTT